MDREDDNEKIALQSWCDKCGIVGYILVDDIDGNYVVKCPECKQLTGSQVFCESCEVGGTFIKNIASKPSKWSCPQCATEYPLNKNIYNEPIDIVPGDMPQEHLPNYLQVPTVKKENLFSDYQIQKVLVSSVVLFLIFMFVMTKIALENYDDLKKQREEKNSKLNSQSIKNIHDNDSNNASYLNEKEYNNTGKEIKNRYKILTDDISQEAPKYQKYMEAWSTKVKRMALLNYPRAATKIQRPVKVLVEVAIKVDGSLQNIKIIESSGNFEIDEGVKNFIALAAPFSDVFQEGLDSEIDMLKIRRAFLIYPRNK